MADVFISYAKARHELTESLAKDLEAAGLSVWWDTSLRPGENFRNEIDEQLDNCKAAVIVWTLESIKSDWVIAEADHAWQLKKLVNTHVPELKPYQIPKPFNQIHSVEITNRSIIIEAVRKRVAEHAQHAAAPEGDRLKETPKNARRRFGSLGLSYVRLCLAVAAVAASLAGWALLGVIPTTSTPPAATPLWNFEGDTFIGQPIPLTWKYERRPSTGRTEPETPILFELSSSASSHFGPDARTATYADGDHKYVSRINATRYWRVRVVESRTKKALSDWSNAVQVTQYDSAFDRIKATGNVLVNVSNAEIQGAFKWVDDKGFRGFDIKLANLIVERLSSGVGRKLEMVLVPVPWAQLLDTPNQGRADFIISSITRLQQRQRDFRIEFSDAYYCTSHVLMYRSGKPEQSIREMVAGKVVGVQEKTTNAHLAEEMAKGGLFQVQAFDTTEKLVDALLRSNIDFGVADTPFAITAQHATRLNGRNRLSFKKFGRMDFPPSIPQEEQVEEYALAVRAGEYELLSAINGAISKAKIDGSLARFLKEATVEFEDTLSDPRDARGDVAPNDRPWECSP